MTDDNAFILGIAKGHQFEAIAGLRITHLLLNDDTANVMNKEDWRQSFSEARTWRLVGDGCLIGSEKEQSQIAAVLHGHAVNYTPDVYELQLSDSMRMRAQSTFSMMVKRSESDMYTLMMEGVPFN